MHPKKHETRMSNDARIAILETTISNINSTLLDFKQEMRNGFQRLDSKIDSKIDALEHKTNGKIDALEHKIDNKIDALEHKMDSKLDVVDSKINALEHKMDSKFDVLDGKSMHSNIRWIANSIRLNARWIPSLTSSITACGQTSSGSWG